MIRIGGQKVPFQTILLVASESLLIGLALVLASMVTLADGYSWGKLTSAETIGRFLLVVIICEFALYYYDLYDYTVVSRRSVLFVQLLQAVGVACLLLAVLYYWEPRLSLGRGIAALAGPAILMIVLSWRLLLEVSAPLLRHSERVVILGTGTSGQALAQEILLRPEFGLEVIGFLEEPGDESRLLPGDETVLGPLSEVEAIVQNRKVDRVVLSLAERRRRMPVRELLHLKFAGVKIEDAHSVYERMSGRIMLEHLNPSWLILSDGFHKSQVIVVAKRILDVAISAMALVITAPFMLLVSAAIWIESGAPLVFRQKRVGLNGREFEMLKFRSMYRNSEQRGPAWASKSDPRITRVGRFIRKYRLDELPQLINVLLGDMSIVGPRPEQPYFVQLLEEKIPYYGQRHSVRPGITGWAQVRFHYGASVEETKTKLEYDLFYVKHLSIFLDCVIIFETWKVLLSGRGAK